MIDVPHGGDDSVLTPLIVDFNAADFGKKFSESLHETGFALIRLKAGQLGIYKWQLEAAREENIRFMEAPFEEKVKSLFLNDSYKDAGWFPFGAEGRTGGDFNLLEYLHHRTDRRGADFGGFDFSNTWGVNSGIQRLTQRCFSALAHCMPDDHPNKERMLALQTELDDGKRNVVRFLKYMGEHPFKPGVLPAFDQEEGKIRLWNDPHEDADLLTFIPMQSKPGLQLKGNDGKWHSIPWVAGDDLGDDIMIVVNAGDTLSAASGGTFALCKTEGRNKLAEPLTFNEWKDDDQNLHMWRDGFYYTDRKLRLVKQGYYPSTTHRVVAGEGVRYSMPFFRQLNGWVKVQGHWTAYDKMRGYVRNKEAHRAKALADIYEQNGVRQAA